MKIVIPGGSGFIGQGLAHHFGPGHDVVVLTRQTGERNNAFGRAAAQAAHVREVYWNGKDAGDWCRELEGAQLVVNLAGKSVNCRYNAANRAAILNSRLQATQAIGEAIRQCRQPPEVWINLASATIYRHATDRPQDEYTGEMHDDFSVQVCRQWEQVFREEATPQTRKVLLRTAITLGTTGVMVPFLNLCKLGLGGQQGSGKQMFSWIHITDLCRIVAYAYQNRQLEGVYNASSPNPVTNTVFMQTLRKVTGNKIGLPATGWMLRLGTKLIGSEAELVLKSRWVLPVRLQEAGFVFRYPEIQAALEDIVAQLPRHAYRLL
jgi:uncharacterized protein (TIGR01777 family)